LYADAGVPEYWRIEEDATGEAIVYQHRPARLTDGTTIYAETRVTTLTALESA
jgi:hypothetical protein